MYSDFKTDPKVFEVDKHSFLTVQWQSFTLNFRCCISWIKCWKTQSWGQFHLHVAEKLDVIDWSEAKYTTSHQVLYGRDWNMKLKRRKNFISFQFFKFTLKTEMVSFHLIYGNEDQRGWQKSSDKDFPTCCN